jgi:predicted MFS family arabinose efflux permease
MQLNSANPIGGNTALPISRRLGDAFTMFFVALLSVWLLIFIAYGTSKRTYEQLLIDKSAAQAELVRNPIEAYLRPGLPLRQFTGFKQVTTSMLEGDPMLISIAVELMDAELAFNVGDMTVRTLQRSDESQVVHGDGDVRRSNDLLQIVLPLKNKFERVGQLVLTMDRKALFGQLAEKFRLSIGVALLACVLFGVVVFRASGQSTRATHKTIAIAYFASFAAAAFAVVLSMVSLFAAGTDAKGRALVDSLGQRLDDIPQYGLQLDQIDGLDSILDSYRLLNQEISSIGITVNGRVVVHTDRSRVGMPWLGQSSQSEYRAMLTPASHPRAAQVILSVPRDYVFWQVVRNVKNYAALFVASSLFAFLFLQLAQSVQSEVGKASTGLVGWRSSLALELVKPVFFLAAFVDHLSYAFLPQFVSAIAASNGELASGVAWPFTAYYLCFALALLPAGHYATRVGPRNLLVFGLVLVTFGLMSMGFVQSLAGAVVARATTGIGQGVIFIGVQSYILSRAHRNQRTRANGIIVYGYQGGMISGMAIGSLLVGEIGAAGVFGVAAVLGAAVVAYSVLLLPVDKLSAPVGKESAGVLSSWTAAISLLRDPQFAQTILLVGIPAKAVLTGVVLFGVPLLLNSFGFAKEDIGQITMVYAGCVIFASFAAGRIAERSLSCRFLLVAGSVLSAIGLMLIAAAGFEALVGGHFELVIRAALFLAGAAAIGAGHGFINAPIVTYVTELQIAERLGADKVAASYRFLERAGHMLGPILVGQLFLTFGVTPLVIGWVALLIALCALFFQAYSPSEMKSRHPEEFA